MINKIMPLNCNDCPLSRDNNVCDSVASLSMKDLAGLGYDTSSDLRPNNQIFSELILDNDVLRPMVITNCLKRLGQLSNINTGVEVHQIRV